MEHTISLIMHKMLKFVHNSRLSWQNLTVAYPLPAPHPSCISGYCCSRTRKPCPSRRQPAGLWCRIGQITIANGLLFHSQLKKEMSIELIELQIILRIYIYLNENMLVKVGKIY